MIFYGGLFGAMFVVFVDLFGLGCWVVAVGLRWLCYLVVFGLVLVLAYCGGLRLIVVVYGCVWFFGVWFYCLRCNVVSWLWLAWWLV